MLGAHLLALVLVATAGALALWQYDAWQARRAADAVDVTALTARPLVDVMGPDEPFPGGDIGQPVTLAGTWSDQGSVVVTDREQDGRTGVWVVTPVDVEGVSSAIPVVRGWAASADDVPPPPTGAVTLTGYLQPSEGRTVTDPDPTDDALPQLRTADLLQRVDGDLYGAYVVEAGQRAGDPASTNTGSDGLERADVTQVPASSQFTALRNLLYAIEWVVFGAFAVFVWWRYVRDELQARRRRDDAEADEPDLAPAQ